MSALLLERMVNPGNLAFYSDAFRQIIEDHLTYLRGHSETRLEEIPNELAYMYEGDFYGLLGTKKIRPEYHYAHMRVNGLTSPTEFIHTGTAFVRVSDAAIERLMDRYRTVNQIR